MGLDPSVISLAVSSENSIKIYRALKSEEDIYQLHEVGELPVNAAFVNAIAWAPGGVNPLDIIAVACDDSTVRMIEISVQEPPGSVLSTRNQTPQAVARRDSASNRSVTSGISVGLADKNRTTTARNGTSAISLKHEVKEIALLPHTDGVPVYRLEWSIDGTAFPWSNSLTMIDIT